VWWHRYDPRDHIASRKRRHRPRDRRKIGLNDPTQTLHFPTNVTKANELNQLGLDRTTAIVTGREPLAALDTAIKDWRSCGGD